MKKQFLINLLLLVFLNALIKPFWVLGIDRSIQNIVGSDVYGLYFALFNFSVLFNTFLDLGITNFSNRSIAQNPSVIFNYFPKLVYVKLYLGIIYLLLCLGLAALLGYSADAVKLLGILALNQFLASMLLFLRSNISGLQLFTIDSILSVFDRFLMILFCGLLLWTNFTPIDFDIYAFAFIQTFSYVLSCIAAIAVILSKSKGLSFRIIPAFSFEMLRKCFPYALLGFLMVIYNRIDGVLLERLHPDGARAAGVYAQSFRIFDAVTMISVLFASLLLPMLSKQIAKKESIEPLIKISFSILFTCTSILIINLIVFARPLLTIMYREYYPESVNVFIILMLSIIPVSLTYIFGTLLTADGRLNSLNSIAGFTLLVNIILNVLLIPEIGVRGAAITALISQIIVAAFQIILCRRYNVINASFKDVAIYLMFFLVSIIIAFFFQQLNFNNLVKLVFSMGLSVCFAFALKIINLREVFTIITPVIKPS